MKCIAPECKNEGTETWFKDNNHKYGPLCKKCYEMLKLTQNYTSQEIAQALDNKKLIEG